jgi:hypothetical protein
MSSPTDAPDDAAPQCAVCREREAFGRLHDSGISTDWYWYCVECLEAFFERDRALLANPALARVLPPLPTPTWRPGRGVPLRTPYGRRTV